MDGRLAAVQEALPRHCQPTSGEHSYAYLKSWSDVVACVVGRAENAIAIPTA